MHIKIQTETMQACIIAHICTVYALNALLKYFMHLFSAFILDFIR